LLHRLRQHPQLPLNKKGRESPAAKRHIHALSQMVKLLDSHGFYRSRPQLPVLSFNQLFSGKKGIPVKKEGIVYNYIGNMIAKENSVSPNSIGKRLQSVNGSINAIHFINKLNGVFIF
jgi:hypothetical protein